MKIQFLGTAAAEGIPALFCNCSICENAREKGGKEIRTRSQAIIDNKLLIDFPPDAYMHMLNNGLRYLEIEALIVTHSHDDHFFPNDLNMRKEWFAYGVTNVLNIYGNEKTGKKFEQNCEAENKYLNYNIIEPYMEYSILDYKVTPLLATHDKSERCYIYIISDGKKTLLYGNDTGFFCGETWNYIKDNKIKFDFVSLDCTCMSDPEGTNHMGFSDTVKLKSQLLSSGNACDSTIFYLHHFSHNGKWTHEEIEKHAKEAGFLVSYDGCADEF